MEKVQRKIVMVMNRDTEAYVNKLLAAGWEIEERTPADTFIVFELFKEEEDK